MSEPPNLQSSASQMEEPAYYDFRIQTWKTPIFRLRTEDGVAEGGSSWPAHLHLLRGAAGFRKFDLEKWAHPLESWAFTTVVGFETLILKSANWSYENWPYVDRCPGAPLWGGARRSGRQAVSPFDLNITNTYKTINNIPNIKRLTRAVSPFDLRVVERVCSRVSLLRSPPFSCPPNKLFIVFARLPDRLLLTLPWLRTSLFYFRVLPPQPLDQKRFRWQHPQPRVTPHSHVSSTVAL